MIQKTIDDLGKSSSLSSMTIVTIAHRLSTVENSDVIYVLQGGEVMEQGSHKELTAKEGGIYQALAAAQGAVMKRQVSDTEVDENKEDHNGHCQV